MGTVTSALAVTNRSGSFSHRRLVSLLHTSHQPRVCQGTFCQTQEKKSDMNQQPLRCGSFFLFFKLNITVPARDPTRLPLPLSPPLPRKQQAFLTVIQQGTPLKISASRAVAEPNQFPIAPARADVAHTHRLQVLTRLQNRLHRLCFIFSFFFLSLPWPLARISTQLRSFSVLGK